MFAQVKSLFSNDIGIDLGTANSLVYVRDQGIVLREPSVVAIQAGAREVYLIEQPKASAIGVGLPVHEPAGNMIVDIGGGTCEIAIISLAGIVFSRSLRVGGDEFDETIVAHMKRAYNLMIGERTAEEIKIRIGSAFPLEQELTMEVKGRDLSAGLPKTLTIRSEEIREALQEPLSSILESVRI